MDVEEEMKPRSHKAKGFAEGEMAGLDEAGCRQEPNPLSHSSVTVLSADRQHLLYQQRGEAVVCSDKYFTAKESQ